MHSTLSKPVDEMNGNKFYPRLMTDGRGVVILAFDPETSTVVNSTSDAWEVGENYGSHGSFVEYDGSVTLQNG